MNAWIKCQWFKWLWLLASVGSVIMLHVYRMPNILVCNTMWSSGVAECESDGVWYDEESFIYGWLYISSHLYSVFRSLFYIYSFANDFSFEKLFASLLYTAYTLWSLRRCVCAFITFNGILSLVSLIAYAVFNSPSFSIPPFHPLLFFFFCETVLHFFIEHKLLFIKALYKTIHESSRKRLKQNRKPKTKPKNETKACLWLYFDCETDDFIATLSIYLYHFDSFDMKRPILNRNRPVKMMKPFDFRFLFSLDTKVSFRIE